MALRKVDEDEQYMRNVIVFLVLVYNPNMGLNRVKKCKWALTEK